MPSSSRRRSAIAPLMPTIFTITTQLGPLEIELLGDAVSRLRFSTAQRAPSRDTSLSPRQLEIAKTLQQYAAGEPVDLAAIEVDLSGCTPFAARVYRECRKIRSGTTMSYGDLAAKAGSPNAARAVGTAMARNRISLLIPCHRVVASGGKIGGYSAPQGLKLKERLLKLERDASR